VLGARAFVISGWHICLCSRGNIYAQDAPVGIEIGTY
jgi:hypothetical protein